MVNNDPLAELLDQLNANIDLHRVLWMVDQISVVWAIAEIFRDEPEIVKHVVDQKLIEPWKDPETYVFTAKGKAELERWFDDVYPHREKPGFREIWKRVTGRDD
jgi:hypothetical protein